MILPIVVCTHPLPIHSTNALALMHARAELCRQLSCTTASLLILQLGTLMQRGWHSARLPSLTEGQGAGLLRHMDTAGLCRRHTPTVFVS